MNKIMQEQLREVILKYTSQKYSFVQYLGFKDIEDGKQLMKIVDTLGGTEYYFYLLPSFECYIEAYSNGTPLTRSKRLSYTQIEEHNNLLLEYELWYLMNR